MTDNHLKESMLETGIRRPSVAGYVLGGSKYKLLGKYFAKGNSGEIHFGKNISTDELVAAKLVLKDHKTAHLDAEYRIYQLIGQSPGIPKIHYFGECGKYNALIMDLLGPTLDEVFGECEHKFSVKTCAQLAIQLVALLEHVHSRRVIFRNVKPENFCLGQPNTKTANRLYLIGFIHANEYVDETGAHIDKRKGLPFGGTPRYMSLRSHKGKEQSRRDDLEAVGHMLVYFARGSLPWQGLQAVNELEQYDKIYRVKKETKLEALCQDLPVEFYHYMLYVRTLKFATEPNYKYLKAMFGRLLERSGHRNDDVYDWDVRRNETSESNGTHLAVASPKTGLKKAVSFDMNCDQIGK